MQGFRNHLPTRPGVNKRVYAFILFISPFYSVWGCFFYVFSLFFFVCFYVVFQHNVSLSVGLPQGNFSF